MRRALAFLSVLFLFLCFGLRVFAAEPVYTEGALEYRIEDGGIIIIGYFGTGGTVVIPQEIAGLPVSEVAEGAFADAPVTELTVPDTMMKISENAVPPSCRIVFAGQGEDENGEKEEGTITSSMGTNETETGIEEEDGEDKSRQPSKAAEVEAPSEGFQEDEGKKDKYSKASSGGEKDKGNGSEQLSSSGSKTDEGREGQMVEQNSEAAWKTDGENDGKDRLPPTMAAEEGTAASSHPKGLSHATGDDESTFAQEIAADASLWNIAKEGIDEAEVALDTSSTSKTNEEPKTESEDKGEGMISKNADSTAAVTEKPQEGGEKGFLPVVVGFACAAAALVVVAVWIRSIKMKRRDEENANDERNV